MKHTLEHAKRRTDICEHLVTLHDMVVELPAKLVIELGVRGGESTVALLEGVQKTGGRLISVDIEPCPEARAMISSYGLAGSWQFVMADDVDFGRRWTSGTVDMVFVDTSHQYEHTKREIEVYEPILRPGGVMAFHDTTLFRDGVLTPILEFLKAHPDYGFENLENCNGLGIMGKPRHGAGR